jgi:hypothetical protein
MIEQTLITPSGTPARDACPVALSALKRWGPHRATVIPGLDASLCRCPRCSPGVWWVDRPERDRLAPQRRKKA